MKKLLIIIFVFLVSVAISFAQETKKEQAGQSKADQAAKNTATFSTDYFKNKENQHMVFVLKVEDGRISKEVPTLQLRTGKMKKVYTTGSFKVSWLNNQGEELGSYSMEDPTIVRTWEKPEIKKVEKGEFDIRIPKDSRISVLAISRDGKETNRWKVEEQVKRMVEQ